MDERNYPIEARPYHVDVQRDIFEILDYCIDNQKDFFIWKARDKAFSYNMTSIAVKEMMFERRNTMVCLFPKGEEVQYKEQFRAKYDTTFNGLPQCMKQYADIANTKDLLKYGWKERDEETGQEVERGSGNTIAFIKASKKDVVKSFRTKLITVDEAGEIDCLKALLDTNRANMMRGGQKFGTQIIGGTSNSISAAYEDVCYLNDNAEKLGYEKFFIPRYKSLWGWVPYYKSKSIFKEGEEPIGRREAINHETGESLKEVAEEYFERELDKLEKAGDTQGILEFTQNYPKDVNDAFLRTLTSPFDVIALERQKRYIETNEEIKRAVTRGNAVIYFENGVRKARFEENPNGRCEMYLPPDHSLVFPDCIGVDTVMAEEAPESPSKNAVVVYRPFQDMKKLGDLPVLIYHYRHGSLYTFFEDLLAICILYNAKCLIEYLNQMPFDYFEENGAAQYLAQRPSILTELGSKAQNRWGVKAASGAAPALAYAKEKTKDNVDNHVFPALLSELCKFGSVNTDIADAYKWAILLSVEQVKYKKRVEDSKNKIIKPRFERYTTRVNGKLVVVKSQAEAMQYLKRTA